MKRLLIILLLSDFLPASYVMPFKAGWQLIGLSEDMEDMTLFERDEVRVIWCYDALAQSWKGYSPDASIKKRLEEKGIEMITSLQAHQGFWIDSSKSWALKIDGGGGAEAAGRGELKLLKGWNLISLPVNMSISPDLFGDATLWQYDTKEWHLLNGPSSEQNLTRIRSISNLDGFWVQVDANKSIDLPLAASRLHNFSTEEAMKSYIRKMKLDYIRPNYGYIMYNVLPFAFAEEGGSSAGPGADDTSSATVSEVDNVTTTNLQESDVDEHDVVKNDAEKLFYLNVLDHRVYATTFARLLNGDTAPEANITIPSDYYPYYMYLHNDKLAVLCRNWGEGTPNMVNIYDVSDLGSIRKLNTITMDGSFMDKTRRVGNRVFIINSYSPEMRVSYPKLEAEIEAGACEDIYERDGVAPGECYSLRYDWQSDSYYRYDYDNPVILFEKLLPTITSENNATTRNLVEPRNFYAPYKYNQNPLLTMITELDLERAEVVDSIAYLGSVRELYASSQALYLISGEYNAFTGFNSFYNRSTIYKFDYTGPLQFKGKGSVDGTPLNQFSLSEYHDVLRIATTGWSYAGGLVNTLFTLQDTNGSLEVAGKLAGLGKENETIRSVRFVGNKGFVVTYVQTDPFYTIDLSDPADPKKVGELEIPGFSEYMHPVDENRILAIGRDADENGTRGGISVQLFDISDFAAPKLADKVTVGNRSTYSELEYTHKAFAYRDNDKLFGFPYIGDADEYSRHHFDIFQIEDNNTISSLATQSLPEDRYFWGDRGLFFDYNGSRYSVFSAEGNLTIIDIDKGE